LRWDGFVDGIDAAQQVIIDNYLLPEVGAIWTNLQRLQTGATARSKETVEAYTNILIDIDRRVKTDAQDNKINATEAEREVLLQTANRIATAAFDPKTGKELYSGVLAVLKAKFETPEINMEIDTMTGELWTHRLLAADRTSPRKKISKVCCPLQRRL
jgi:hypothetical protein